MTQASQQLVSSTIEKHRDQIMNLPGVVGVGSQGAHNDAILCVYTSVRDMGNTLQDVYSIIDWECPVELEYTGEIHALSADTNW